MSLPVRHLLLLFFLIFSVIPGTAQLPKSFYLSDSIKPSELSPEDKSLLDSLLPQYHKAAHDSERVNTLGRIVESCNDENVWPVYNRIMLTMSENALRSKGISRKETLFFKSKLADAINNEGFLKINTGEVDGALKDFQKSYTIQQEAGNKKGMAHSLSNSGYVYKNKGEIFKAIDAYHRALKLSEQAGDVKGVANLHNNIGLLYKSQGETDKALENYKKSYELWQKIENTAGMSASLNNLAFIYAGKGESETALRYYMQCLKYDKENGDEIGYANSLNNIGLIYDRRGLKDSAEHYYMQSLDLYEKAGSKKGLSEVSNNLAKLSFDNGNIERAQALCKVSLDIANELGYPVLISDAASLMYDIYKRKKDWKSATEMQELHLRMKDSILNNETQKAAMRQQLKYEFEKQEELTRMENQKLAIINQEEKKRQRIITGSVAAGLFLMIVFAGFIFNRYRLSQRQRAIIQKQKAQVDLAYDQLSEKNKEIIDSIHYAKRIQNALLKEEEHVSDHLPDHFILFKPKDIVSGDFYWSHERDGYWYIAAADCTGHGVPGAFLTMLGTSFLNEIVSSTELLSPSKILDELRNKFVKELSQSANESRYDHSLLKDGMDMSLLRLHLASGHAEWAGANNGMLLFRKNGEELNDRFKREALAEGSAVYYIAPDKQPIGYYQNSTPFKNHELKLIEGDTIYLFTDGYADQFGGPQGKKLKFRTLQNMLNEFQEASMNRQKTVLSEKFDEWKGKLEQVDDVTMIGIRI